ncbi:MAG: L,D-transpeptidase family protein [Parvibaculum sp.]|uniref:L,D-transpeptidase family protein n=1 Tax=Parvibaculum sp. TaxID=2024848 RepID=UPI0025DC13AD|nr:L,D-transpeptidase family protein [Parvibaculum sp.]MCE9648868.1 L,D-transpeptidase family protein [Parvibaculum sp.]
MRVGRGFQFLALLLPMLAVGGSFASASSYDPVETQWIDPWAANAEAQPTDDPALKSTVPTLGDAGFWPVVRAISMYRQIQNWGGWEAIPQGEKLEKGMRDRRVALVRKRLLATGDLTASEGDQALFDDAVVQAVRRFQSRHGLDPDGSLGRATLAAMNVPVAARIQQLEVNLKRLNDVAPTLGRRYVFVNIAGQEVEAVEDGDVVIRKRVIVGKEDRQTPEHSSKITYIALNPYWNVPQSIAMKDLLPKIRRNPQFLQRMGIRVLKGWGENAPEVDPSTVDWSAADVTRQYRLRQDPSRLNSLGTVKINFPNPFAVYLHDTPVKTLFGRQARNFSSGCVRVQDVRDLAAWLLKDANGWDRKRIDATIAGGEHKDVSLPQPVPIYLMYLTAWVGEDGVVNFRDDVYDRDRKLSATTLPN